VYSCTRPALVLFMIPTAIETCSHNERNDINMFSIRLIFKFTISFMGPALGPTNSMMDLKLDCIEINRRCVEDVCVSFFTHNLGQGSSFYLKWIFIIRI
jgi:hypothetical protein